MCARPLCFSRYRVLAVGECKHASLLSSGRCWEPPYLAKMWLVRPMYIIPSLPGSFRALRSCFPIHVRYSVLSECAFSPNWLCGSFVVIFGVLFGSPHMAFCRAMIFWSSLAMFGMEYGTA
jgi:hypothetical protein